MWVLGNGEAGRSNSMATWTALTFDFTLVLRSIETHTHYYIMCPCGWCGRFAFSARSGLCDSCILFFSQAMAVCFLWRLNWKEGGWIVCYPGQSDLWDHIILWLCDVSAKKVLLQSLKSSTCCKPQIVRTPNLRTPRTRSRNRNRKDRIGRKVQPCVSMCRVAVSLVLIDCKNRVELLFHFCHMCAWIWNLTEIWEPLRSLLCSSLLHPCACVCHRFATHPPLTDTRSSKQQQQQRQSKAAGQIN